MASLLTCRHGHPPLAPGVGLLPRALETSRADRLFVDPWAGARAGVSGKAMLDAADYNPFLPVRRRSSGGRTTVKLKSEGLPWTPGPVPRVLVAVGG